MKPNEDILVIKDSYSSKNAEMEKAIMDSIKAETDDELFSSLAKLGNVSFQIETNTTDLKSNYIFSFS